MKKALKIVLWILVAIIILAALFLAWLTVTEYRPSEIETAEITGASSGKAIPSGEDINLISWNIGYSALGKESDFIMDGGGNAPVATKEKVLEYLSGISSTLNENGAAIRMLQEVDTDSSRSYGADERQSLSLSQGVHALNYSCPFVPYPWPPMGKVNSGLFTTSDYEIESSERISLPCPFSWPLRIANLKRCLLASYLPVEGSDRYLVAVNLHLEAYDSGEGKIAQTKVLCEFIESEYKKGNYVIAAGDFNQVMPGSLEIYPNEHPENWVPGILEYDSIPEGWQYAFDLNAPSCRLLNQPYNPEDTANTQYYVIDGFILSPNVELVSVETLDAQFEYSDHNPVSLTIRLAE